MDVQRAGEVPANGAVTIERGDLLWTDFGVVALNLHTDTQHLGYVLREGELEVPEGLSPMPGQFQSAAGHSAAAHGARVDR